MNYYGNTIRTLPVLGHLLRLPRSKRMLDYDHERDKERIRVLMSV